MGQGQLTTLDEVLEESRISKEVMEKYVLNKKYMQKTKIEIENAMVKLRKRQKQGGQFWKGEKFTVRKHMVKQMAFLDGK
jgi:hypothetical protein